MSPFLVLSFTSLGNKGARESDLVIFMIERRHILSTYPQKRIFGNKCRLMVRFLV